MSSAPDRPSPIALAARAPLEWDWRCDGHAPERLSSLARATDNAHSKPPPPFNVMPDHRLVLLEWKTAPSALQPMS